MASKRKPIVFILPVILITGLFFGIRSWYHNSHTESTDNAQVETNSTPVLSRISGYVDSIGIADYDSVKAGQILVKLDDREYRIATLQAKANLLTAEADIQAFKAGEDNARASLSVAKANLETQETRTSKANADLLRDEQLFRDGAITKKQLDDTRATWQTAEKQSKATREQMNLASVQLKSADAQTQKAMAMLEARKAELEQAELKLSYCNILAPASGRIGKRNLGKGQYVQPGQNLFTIVSGDDFWIVANFKETQLENLHAGQTVSIRLDGFKDKTITGKIASFSDATGAKFALLPPDNATGNFVKVTQRIPIKISLDNQSELKKYLRAGLSAEVEVELN